MFLYFFNFIDFLFFILKIHFNDILLYIGFQKKENLTIYSVKFKKTPSIELKLLVQLLMR